MSHEIVSSLLLVDRGPDLLTMVKSASNNVSPRVPRWGCLMAKFENESAAKALLFIAKMDGSFKFDSTLARVRRVGPDELDFEQRKALERVKDQPLRFYTVGSAIRELEGCAANDYYRLGALALVERAVDALKRGLPVPSPNDPVFSGAARIRCPILSTLNQSGLTGEALIALERHPEAAREVGPLGVTPLHRLSNSYSWSDEMKSDVFMSGLVLLDLGADPRAADVLGQTPLHHAATAYYPNESLLKELVARGADINARDRDGNTPLHLALGAGRSLATMALLKLSPDIGLRNAAGHTARQEAGARSDATAAYDRWLARAARAENSHCAGMAR